MPQGQYINSRFLKVGSTFHPVFPADQPLHVVETSQEILESSAARVTQEFIPQTPSVCGESQWVLTWRNVIISSISRSASVRYKDHLFYNLIIPTLLEKLIVILHGMVK